MFSTLVKQNLSLCLQVPPLLERMSWFLLSLRRAGERRGQTHPRLSRMLLLQHWKCLNRFSDILSHKVCTVGVWTPSFPKAHSPCVSLLVSIKFMKGEKKRFLFKFNYHNPVFFFFRFSKTLIPFGLGRHNTSWSANSRKCEKWKIHVLVSLVMLQASCFFLLGNVDKVGNTTWFRCKR